VLQFTDEQALCLTLKFSNFVYLMCCAGRFCYTIADFILPMFLWSVMPAVRQPVQRMKAERGLFSFPKYWAECYGHAPFLPMSREEMDQLGWDSCDIIIVTGDAYVDRTSV
jgi:hypothetical protein